MPAGVNSPRPFTAPEGGIQTTVPGDTLSGSFSVAYALVSDLISAESLNAVVILLFDESWTTIHARKVVPLPTQDCSCHRICVVRDPERPDDASVVVTEMASSNH